MASAAAATGGSIAARPFASPEAGPALAWTGLVAAAGAVLPGQVATPGLLAIAVVAGLTHGTTDLAVARRGFGHVGRHWWGAFLLGYLALVAATLGAWMAAPAAMLLLFLLLSALHFGAQDASGASGRGAPAAILAHGGAPIVLPAAFHPSDVVDIFATLGVHHAEAIQAMIAGPVAGLWLLTIAATVARALRSSPADVPRCIDLGLICCLFAVATPLVAFSLYFALLHTPRAFAAQRARAIALPPGWMVGLTALAGALGLLIGRWGPELAPGDAIVRASFMLLSALTVPHMALDWIDHHVGRRHLADDARGGRDGPSRRPNPLAIIHASDHAG